MSEAPQKVVAVAAEGLEIGGATSGEMKDGLCDCCSHHKSCCAVFWCPSVVFAQLFEKLLGPKGACIAIFTLLQVVGYLAYAASQGAADDDGGGVSTTEMMLSSACTDALILYVLSLSLSPSLSLSQCTDTCAKYEWSSALTNQAPFFAILPAARMQQRSRVVLRTQVLHSLQHQGPQLPLHLHEDPVLPFVHALPVLAPRA